MRRVVPFLLAVTAISASPLQHTWHDLPPKIRKQVHLTTAEIPKFPHEADSLRDIRRWPKTLDFEGHAYTLTYQESGYDVIRVGITRLEDITMGGGYGAYYVPDPKDDPTQRLGPAYYWRRDGTLTSRAYKTSSMSQDWVYDSNGRIGHYAVSKGPSDEEPFRSLLEERFSESGDLIGFNLGAKK